LRKDLDGLATKEFGSYITLNTLTIYDKRTSMSAPQFAKLLEIAHEIAPIYDLKEKNCYWFALLVFLVIRKRTGGVENGGDKIERRGKLWNYKLGGASASVDDEGGVPNHEYERALRDLQVSHCHDSTVSFTNPSRLTQKFVDKMNDPDEAHRMTQAERLAEEERARTVESRKNEENAKKLAEKERGLAEEERRKRLEAEAEVRELRARLGLQGHG
jgi:hypothetical protein